ncbi:membrane-bound inhibitor of C-type lysozyme [Oxalobacteraceae bacterium GrIS 2.11]
MKLINLCSALSIFLACQTSFAQTTASVLKVAAAKPALNIDEDDMTPDIDAGSTFEYHCELKDFLTIYTNGDDNNHIALRWKNRLYRLHRIVTTTGANRFENSKAGLVWIGIPTKGMLLDSRHGQQLANECKTTGQ